MKDTKESGRIPTGQKILLATLILMLLTSLAWGQNYQMPPKVIADMIDAPPTPGVSMDPNHEWVLILERPSMPGIEKLAQPELRLAGIRMNPRTNGPSRTRPYNGLKLKSLKADKEFPVSGIPEGVDITEVSWAPDGKHFAFLVTQKDGITLWVTDVKTKAARQLMDAKINDTYGSAFRWILGSKSLVCKIIPADRGDPPKPPDVPMAPVIQETTGKKAPARTYQDLLKNADDEAIFEYYTTSQIALVNLDGAVTTLGKPGIYRTPSPSPNGKLLLVNEIHKPFSYIVPVYRFPYRVTVWDMQGNVVKEIVDKPLAENIPIGFNAVPLGPRSHNWRADAPATLYWVEAQDEGNPNKEAEIRDAVYMQPEPFDGDPIHLVSLGLRYDGMSWGNGKLALVEEAWWKNRKTRTWIIQPDAPKVKPRKLYDRSYEDRYSDPGYPVFKTNKAGRYVLMTANRGRSLFLMGTGYSPKGNIPFLDELNLQTLKAKRLWHSEAPYYERGITILDKKGKRFLTRRESVTEPPNYFVRELGQKDPKQVTFFPHPTPQLKDASKELIRYTRDDGVELTGTLYLPPGYKKEDGPLPMLMWAYPREFKSAKAAGQVRTSPYQFIRVYWGGALLWLSMGYAVLDGPTMPIIGEGEMEPNDTYVKQLVASAKAAVDEVVRRGVADRDRIAIGGHSYGAFMTANLLAHSDLYAAGIARSGAYNRTLTPFGFQAEERTYWEAPEVYYAMSPFMHADKINEPILLIHGEADNNSGTFPVQSKRYYHALKGHGAKARLVMLPFESHGYRARESVMHCLWEMTEWLEEYVKKN